MRWERVKLKVEAGARGRRGGTAGPGKRWGHTCNAVKHGRFLYVFGGYGKDNRQVNDVHIFDTAKQTWSKPMVKGTPPSPRDSHTCITVGTSLYVFGGTDGKSLLQDLYILDTATNTWAKPKVSGDGPTPREGHSAALIGTRIFIFGGCGKTVDDAKEADGAYLNDLYILDTVKLHWTKALSKGDPPVPRDSHTCSAYGNKLIVLGGEDASDSHLANVHILDTEVMEWKEFQTTGQILTPRAGHVAVSMGKFIFVFGGFTNDRKLFDDLHMLDLDTGVWSKVIVDGVGPSPRFSVAGDCITGGVLFFIGGCNDNLEALDDMYYLDTEIQSERAQDEKPEKSSLRKELKRKRQESQSSLKSPDTEKAIPLAPAAAPKPLVCLANETPAMVPVSHAAPTVKSSLHDFKAADERIFEAKITDVFHYGYTVESVIDGRLLRGLLFSYKPGFAHAVHAYLTKKKLSSNGDISDAKQIGLAHFPEHGISTAGASLQQFGGKQSLATQPVFSSAQSQLYLQPQAQSETQHQTVYQQHYLYPKQIPHFHQDPTHNIDPGQDRAIKSADETTSQEEQKFDALSSHQQEQNPIAAQPQQDPMHNADSGQDRAIQSLDETSSHQAPVEAPGVVTVEGAASASRGFLHTDDPPLHQASEQNTCSLTVQEPPSSSQVTLPPTDECS
ncbi:hypothetical protein GOP47_0029320 [Adiantum capillus-veneris]|nr:hypothetical protein GOP47_0029320 [Adiantum capillus-veneris]